MPGGEKDIFLDLHSMRLGEDWQDQLSTKINACEIMLVVIGPDWLSAKDGATGARRLDNPDDFVRFEIATALARKGIRVVPVLMDGAKVPARADLPENIGKLSLMQGIQIRSDMIEDDVARLARLLQLVATNRASPHRDRPVAGPTTLIFAGHHARLGLRPVRADAGLVDRGCRRPSAQRVHSRSVVAARRLQNA